jgi:MobA/MobL family
MMRSAESQDTILLNLIADHMAIAFVKSTVSGRSNGKSATAMAAYRSGSIIVDKASGKIHDYTKKQGVDHSEILSPIAATPNNKWLTDRCELWNRVEAGEKRYDAQLTREIIIAIPRELGRNDQIALVQEYVQSSYVDRGMIADINLHHLEGENPHAHVMLTMRELKVDEQGIVSFGNKDRTWNDKKLLIKQKLEWDGLANKYLERAGFDVRIDSRSYEEQGIERIPQIHLGVEATAMRKQGIATNRGDRFDRIDKANNNISKILEQIYESELATSNAEKALVKLEVEANRELLKEKFRNGREEEEQKRKDETMLIVGQNYPEIRATPEYQAAAQRSQAAFEKLRESTIRAKRGIPKPQPVPEPIVKWQPILVQPTSQQTIEALSKISQESGISSLNLGNYRMRFVDAARIEVDYQDKLVMLIDSSGSESVSHLVNYSRSSATIDQYERNLTSSISRMLEDLARQREVEREREQARQQELERQLQLERDANAILDFTPLEERHNVLDFSPSKSEIDTDSRKEDHYQGWER